MKFGHIDAPCYLVFELDLQQDLDLQYLMEAAVLQKQPMDGLGDDRS
jgi:hypothetical protein